MHTGAHAAAALLALAALLGGCGVGGEVELTCTPPQIRSTPSASATVGEDYVYAVDASYACGYFFGSCGDAHVLEMAPGASYLDYAKAILWTPSASQAGTDARFAVLVGPDFCGNVARQAWTVHVFPETTPPRVTSTYPEGIGVPLTSALGAWFSEQIEAQSVTAASFLVVGPSGPIAGTVQGGAYGAVFTPGASLPASSTITATLTTAIRDLSGNALAADVSWSFGTGAAPDTAAPSVPAGLAATRVTASEVVLGWSASSDDTGVAGYRLYRNGALAATVTATGTTDIGLEFATAYDYAVSAFDHSGNDSGASAPLNVVTRDFQAGSVATWGYALRVDDGTFRARTVPDVAVVCAGACAPLDGVTAIAHGGYNRLAVSHGAAWQWELNDPAIVANSSGTATLAAAPSHSVAAKSDGTAWAWGRNAYGELGDGTTNAAATPVQMLGLGQVTAAAAGLGHSLALKSDGTVWATGGNWWGQLGDGTTTPRSTAAQVQGLAGVAAIAAARGRSLARKPDGTLWAWGGTSYSAYSSVPAQVPGIADVVAIALGDGFSLVVKSDGTVWAWGVNGSGQLGDGTTTNRATPVQVVGLAGVRGVAAGDNHSLALRSDGTVWAWGYNGDGQLGDGTTTSRLAPVQVLRLAAVRAIAAGQRSSLALR